MSIETNSSTGYHVLLLSERNHICDCGPFDMSQVLFPNESVPIILARMIGTIGPIDMEMLASGQETQKYFTDDYDLFHKNEVIVGSYARLST